MIELRYKILIVLTVILCACTNEPEKTQKQKISTLKETTKDPEIRGCTDSNALNFDSLANTNTGSIYPGPGCTDSLAFNFNVNANEDDGSCIPTFNADSAYYFVEKQVSFGPRVISSKGWKNCAIWLEQKFKTYTPHVIIQQAPTTTYDGKNHTLKNIIASFSPEKNNRVALFAHWDSRHIADHDTENQKSPILGANDGGSGVGILLEMARQFSIKNPKIGVDIILFDAEDYGQPENSTFPIMQDSWCLGSQHWSNNPHKQNYFARYGILLDMVGGKDATFYREGYSMNKASSVVEKVWNTANNLGFGNHFIYQNSPKPIIDDHYYVNAITAIPTIDIIEYDPSTENNFNKHWHTHKDDMDNIDKNTLNAVGQTLLEVIYNE